MNYYINRFIALNCAGELLNRKLFPNAKEITESFAAFKAIIEYIPYNRKTDKVQVVCVGDGHTPRTGALISMLTSWNVISIDPVMRIKDYNIKRLELIKAKIEDVQLEYDCPVIIVCVHSHAKLTDCLKSIKANERYIITIPCCVPSDLTADPIESYIDNDIDSEKRKVEIYKLF